MTVRRRRNREGVFRWVIDILYKTTDGRKRRYRRDAQIQMRTAAHKEERDLIARLVQTGTLAPAPAACEHNRITFRDAVEHFRKTHAVTRLKPSTRLGYEQVLTATLLPRFGSHELDAIDPQAIVALDVELTADDLKPATRANVLNVLRSVLRRAVEAELLATMPRFPKAHRPGRTIENVLTEEQVRLALRAALPAQRVAFALAAFAGLRAGEVRALRWTDVDLVRGEIVVRFSRVRGQDSTPKSGKNRIVPIAEPLRAALETAKAGKPSPFGLVAPSGRGTAWSDWGLLQAFGGACERAGIGHWRFHDLRHFFVTELLRRRVPPVTVKELAGHADIATTMHYAHIVAKDRQTAIAVFDGFDAAAGA
jgi:integrase